MFFFLVFSRVLSPRKYCESSYGGNGEGSSSQAQQQQDHEINLDLTL